MKVIFRKHGNFLLYGILPLFFLILTIALIQISPKISHSDPGDDCSEDQPCVTRTIINSLGDEFCNEDTDKCQTVNVGCIDGTVDQTNDSCVCLDDDGQPSGNCIICPVTQEFDDVTGTCVIPGITELSGTSVVCSLNKNAVLPPGAWLNLAFAASFLGAMIGYRKDRKKA